MDKVRVTYEPRPDATSASEAAALAAVYRFVLDRYVEKQDANWDVQFTRRKEVSDEAIKK